MRDLQKGCKAAPEAGAVFHPLVDLQAAINRLIAEQHADPAPFTWTADPDKILVAVKRGHHSVGFDPLEREGLEPIT